MAQEIIIKGGHGGRINVNAGQRLEILNLEGQQICDFFAFACSGVAEFLSPAHTRSQLMKISLARGDTLYSISREPMFEIVEDTVGCHDFIFPACDPARYRLGFGLGHHRNCRTNLSEAMVGHNIPFEHLPDPINFFQNTPVQQDGTIVFATSEAKAGDRVVLHALVDVIAVGSACAMDLTGINGAMLSDIRMSILDD